MMRDNSFNQVYTRTTAQEPNKIVLSDDAFAVGEMLNKILDKLDNTLNKLEHIRVSWR